MIYHVGDKIKSKKPHACGGFDWTVARVGADVKIKCERCGKSVFLSFEKVQKMVKSVVAAEESNG